MTIRYELAVLTHGRSETLAATLASFREHVRPLPHRIRLFADGVEDAAYPVGVVRGVFPDVEDPAVSATHPTRQAGFCGATGRLWRLCAGDEDIEYVFWLEHDFLFDRRVALEQLAGVLDDPDEMLAQVALVRQACNLEESRAGGVVESRPDAFVRRRSTVEADGVSWFVEWLSHRAFFTTNPSLMRRDFMAGNPFLCDGQPACEGRYGMALLSLGYRFGYWGDGLPWVRHVGQRSGRGY